MLNKIQSARTERKEFWIYYCSSLTVVFGSNSVFCLSWGFGGLSCSRHADYTYPALHHSLCQSLSSKLDYVELCCWKTVRNRTEWNAVSHFLHDGLVWSCKQSSWFSSVSERGQDWCWCCCCAQAICFFILLQMKPDSYPESKCTLRYKKKKTIVFGHPNILLALAHDCVDWYLHALWCLQTCCQYICISTSCVSRCALWYFLCLCKELWGEKFIWISQQQQTRGSDVLPSAAEQREIGEQFSVSWLLLGSCLHADINVFPLGTHKKTHSWFVAPLESRHSKAALWFWHVNINVLYVRKEK